MAERPFWNDIEGASASEVRALEDRKLAGQIDYLFANSTFEYAQGLPANRLPGLRNDIENSLRDSLVFRPEVTLVPAGTFATPGRTKVEMIERVQPSGGPA